MTSIPLAAHQPKASLTALMSTSATAAIAKTTTADIASNSNSAATSAASVASARTPAVPSTASLMQPAESTPAPAVVETVVFAGDKRALDYPFVADVGPSGDNDAQHCVHDQLAFFTVLPVKNPHMIHTVAIGPAGRKLQKEDLIIVMHASTGTTAEGNPVIASRPHFSGTTSAEDVRLMSPAYVLKNVCQDPQLSKQLLVWKRDRSKLWCSMEGFRSSCNASGSPLLSKVLSNILFDKHAAGSALVPDNYDMDDNSFSKQIPVSKSNARAFAMLLELSRCHLAACAADVQEEDSLWNDWALTPKGLGKLQFGHAAVQPKPAIECHRPLPLTDANIQVATSYELALHLHAAGWEWQPFPKKLTTATRGFTIVPALAAGDGDGLDGGGPSGPARIVGGASNGGSIANTTFSSKVWRTRTIAVNLQYLRCLAQAHELNKRFGIDFIPHGAHESVYSNILKGISPNVAAAAGAAQRKQKRLKHMFDLEIDIGGALMDAVAAVPHSESQGRGRGRGLGRGRQGQSQGGQGGRGRGRGRSISRGSGRTAMETGRSRAKPKRTKQASDGTQARHKTKQTTKMPKKVVPKNKLATTTTTKKPRQDNKVQRQRQRKRKQKSTGTEAETAIPVEPDLEPDNLDVDMEVAGTTDEASSCASSEGTLALELAAVLAETEAQETNSNADCDDAAQKHGDGDGGGGGDDAEAAEGGGGSAPRPPSPTQSSPPITIGKPKVSKSKSHSKLSGSGSRPAPSSFAQGSAETEAEEGQKAIETETGEEANFMGKFRVTSKRPAKTSSRFGGYQAVCVFHRKNEATVCCKFFANAGPEQEQIAHTLSRLKHWCGQAPQYNRAWKHNAFHPQIEECPPEAVLDQILQSLKYPASAPLTDAALDSQETKAAAKAKAKAHKTHKQTPKPRQDGGNGHNLDRLDQATCNSNDINVHNGRGRGSRGRGRGRETARNNTTNKDTVDDTNYETENMPKTNGSNPEPTTSTSTSSSNSSSGSGSSSASSSSSSSSDDSADVAKVLQELSSDSDSD